MKPMIVLVIIIAMTFISSLSAQQTASIQQLENFKVTHSDTLTSTYAGFAHFNWTQAGVGITVKKLLFMWNRTFLPANKNYKEGRTMDYVTSQDPIPAYEVNYSYDTLMAGYIVRMFRDVYPYAGTGTAIRTDMVEVTDPDENPDVYTVKGKSTTFATGIIGVIYAPRNNFLIEGSVQLNPVLPFLGVGFSF